MPAPPYYNIFSNQAAESNTVHSLISDDKEWLIQTKILQLTWKLQYIYTTYPAPRENNLRLAGSKLMSVVNALFNAS